MVHIQHKNYIILNINELPDPYINFCLGVISYLFVKRQGKFGQSYIPSGFIGSLSSHCKVDLIGYLITHNYIHQIPPSKTNSEFYNITGLTKNVKKDANLYVVHKKLLELKEVYLYDDRLTTFLDSHIHLLNNQVFNHYEHSYKWIKVNLPYEERYIYDISTLNAIDRMGDSVSKEYDISDFSYDNNRWCGEHYNVFTHNKELLKYTSLINPIEIGFKDSIPVLLADQLLKTIGENDYSDFYKRSRFAKSLFRFEIDYDIFDEIFYQQFYTAIFGFWNVNEFKSRFPQTHSLLWRIKNGGRGLELPFIGFTKNMNPPILKNDRRLHLEETHSAFKQGQSYYRIVSLVCQLREIKIMREVWKRLKRCDIIFIPLTSSVVVSSHHTEVVSYVFADVLRHHINKNLKTVVSKKFVDSKLSSTFGMY